MTDLRSDPRHPTPGDISVDGGVDDAASALSGRGEAVGAASQKVQDDYINKDYDALGGS